MLCITENNCENSINDDEERISTRSQGGPLFHISKPNCESFRRNINYSGALEWNNLNADIRNSENIFAFKKLQKNWLLETYVI